MDNLDFIHSGRYTIENPQSHLDRIMASGMSRERTMDDVLVKRTLEQVAFEDLSPGMKVLELGLGTGTVLRQLVRDYRVKGFGLDLSNIVPIGIPQINIVEANLEDSIPFENETFDLVYAIQVIPYIMDKLGLIREVHRVLKIESFGAVLDTTSYHSHQFFGVEFNKLLRNWSTEDQVEGNYGRHPRFVGRALKSIVIERLNHGLLQFPSLMRAEYFSNPRLCSPEEFIPQVASFYG